MVLLPDWIKRLFRNDKWGKRLLLAFVFIFFLSFFFRHQEVLVEHLEVDTPAKKYVLAEVGFEFPDAEATILLKQESLRDVGRAYRVDDKQIIQWNAEVEKRLVEDSGWRDRFPNTTFKKMFDAKEKICHLLKTTTFIDGRTLQKMQEVSLPTDRYCTAPDCALSDPLPEEQYILNCVPIENWAMIEDLEAQNHIRESVRSSIAIKHTRVEAGSRIINAGDRVTPRHIAMIQAMKTALSESRNQHPYTAALGSFLLAVLLAIVSILYVRIHHPQKIRSFQKLALLVAVLILTLSFAKGIEYLLINKSRHLVEMFRYPIFVLFGTLLVSLLFSRETALPVSYFLSVVLSASLAIHYNHFLVINTFTALIAILAVRKVRRRKDVFEACAKVWMALVPLMIALNLFENHSWHHHLMIDLLVTFLFIAGTAIVVVGLLPILESTFDVVTDMTLMEYGDRSHPLMRRLSIEAPGTFQHSLALGTIAEAAALSIRASGLFCRIAALYHDIGKLYNPHYFTENQLPGFNIHHLLTPQESAQVIMSHVQDGIALAEKHHLPQRFVDVIREHHGTNLVYCFYRAQLEITGENHALFNEESFRYRGPKPRSKESAIIMLCDCIEATFRSLDELTEANVTLMVEKLVGERVQGGQLDECQLTFEELGKIKQSITRTLLATRHTRVKYPHPEASFVSKVEAIYAGRV
jgi:putative nucleotidyltransferase with HDIG domain